MGAHGHHVEPIKAEKYTPSAKVQSLSKVLIGIGLIAAIASFVIWPDRAWASFLFNNFYFLCLGLGGAIFVTLMSATAAGWAVPFRRIAEAFTSVIPIAGALMVVIIASAMLHINHLYHWAAEGVTDPNSHHFDAIIAEKSAYLNGPFMITRLIIAVTIWTLILRKIRSLSVLEDEMGGISSLKKIKTLSSVFLVFYAVSWAMTSWDLLMSIDAHWFSTIYWVYQFANSWVMGLSAMAITAILLKRAGYLKMVNENHLHDIGKLMFAFSIFWTYIWLSQYLLIWYANLPEESAYYLERFEDFKPFFFLNLLMNFISPFLLFMMRDAKRKENSMLIVAGIILSGHWLDQWLGVMPGTIGKDATFGVPELGFLCLFIGLFIHFVTKSMAKASLIPTKHPYIKEAQYHSI